MAMRRVLHIGQRKTGTTWLQYGVQRAAEAGALSLQHWDISKWCRTVTWKSATDENYDALAALLPTETTRPAFATCEGLMVHDPARLASAVCKVWPDVHVLVTTRAPQDYLVSSFNNASMSGHGDVASFVTRFSRGHMARSHDLDGVLKGFGDAAGADHVHFLPYEMLRDDRASYVDRIENLLGAPLGEYLPEDKINASPPPVYLALARRVNALIDEQSPEILKSVDWLNFMRVANFSAGNARGLDQYFADYFTSGAKISDALPRLDVAAASRLASRMTVLGTLPDYKPYLARYGAPAMA